MRISRLGAIGFVFLTSVTFAADLKVGDNIEGKSGGFWTPGKVLAVDGSRYRVHYTNYGAAFDTWLTDDQIRTPQPGATDTAAAAIDRFNEKTRRIRSGQPTAPAKTVDPTDVAMAQEAQHDTPPTPDATASTFSVGSAVQVKWHDASVLYPAKILAVEPGRYKVHYDHYSASSDEWIEAKLILPADATLQPAAEAPPPAPAVAVQPPAAGKGGLDGYYHQLATRFGYHGMMYYSDEYFWFRSDGFAYFSVPPGGLEDFADFSKLQKLDPGNCGAYSVTGGKLTYQRGSDAPHTYDLTFEDGTNVLHFDGPAAIKVGKFPAEQKLECSYFSDAIAADANATVAAGSTINFHNNGTFDGGRVGIVDSQGPTVGMSGSSQTSDRGTYHISGNTITMTRNGQTTSLMTYPWPTKNESPPEHMAIGKEMYRLQK